MVNCIKFIFAAVCVFSVLASGAQVIGFESPAYTAGAGLPSPWLIGSNAVVGITSSGALAGSQSLYAGQMPGSYACRYPITAPADNTMTFSVTIKTAPYNPGNYDSGYVSLGGIGTTDWYLGAVYFEMNKPYGAAIAPSHRQIWFKNAYNVVGYFVDGEVYTITYTIDWTTKTSVVRIVGDGGVDLTLNNQDNGISKTNFTGINFLGRTSVVPSSVLFDNFTIGALPQPIAGDINNNGIVDIYDFAAIALSWYSILGDANYNAVCNLDNSGDSLNKIDNADLAVLCGNWLVEN